MVQSKLHYAKIFASVKIKNGISLIPRPENATRGLFFLRNGRQISPFAPLSRNDTQKTLSRNDRQKDTRNDRQKTLSRNRLAA